MKLLCSWLPARLGNENEKCQTKFSVTFLCEQTFDLRKLCRKKRLFIKKKCTYRILRLKFSNGLQIYMEKNVQYINIC